MIGQAPPRIGSWEQQIFMEGRGAFVPMAPFNVDLRYLSHLPRDEERSALSNRSDLAHRSAIFRQYSVITGRLSGCIGSILQGWPSGHSGSC